MQKFNKDDPLWLVRYLLFAAAEGTVAGWILMELILHMNIANMGVLIFTSPNGAVAYLVMAMSFAVTFGIVGIAIRVMFDLPEHIERGSSDT